MNINELVANELQGVQTATLRLREAKDAIIASKKAEGWNEVRVYNHCSDDSGVWTTAIAAPHLSIEEAEKLIHDEFESDLPSDIIVIDVSSNY